MELKDNQMLITAEDGKEVIVNILFTYDNEERNSSYVVFSPVGDDDSLFAMKYTEDKDDLIYIEDENELAEVQEVVDAFLEEKDN